MSNNKNNIITCLLVFIRFHIPFHTNCTFIISWRTAKATTTTTIIIIIGDEQAVYILLRCYTSDIIFIIFDFELHRIKHNQQSITLSHQCQCCAWRIKCENICIPMETQLEQYNKTTVEKTNMNNNQKVQLLCVLVHFQQFACF